jgi:TolB-like protein
VNETLEGNSNRLKEYTIAVNVLDKPRDFKPQENGIVRIHAGRLRRALSHFYEEKGSQDEIQIYIPKGKYVPLISDRKNNYYNTDMRKTSYDSVKKSNQNESVVVAVMPFLCLDNNPILSSFSEGLCFRITEALMQMHGNSVISYQAMRSLCQKMTDFKQIGTAVGANYLIAGSAQYLKNNIRVYVQVIESASCMLVWSKLVERKLTSSNLFKIEDEISALVYSEFKEFPQFTRQDNLRPVGLAVI